MMMMMDVYYVFIKSANVDKIENVEIRSNVKWPKFLRLFRHRLSQLHEKVHRTFSQIEHKKKILYLKSLKAACSCIIYAKYYYRPFAKIHRSSPFFDATECEWVSEWESIYAKCRTTDAYRSQCKHRKSNRVYDKCIDSHSRLNADNDVINILRWYRCADKRPAYKCIVAYMLFTSAPDIVTFIQNNNSTHTYTFIHSRYEYNVIDETTWNWTLYSVHVITANTIHIRK